MTFLNLAPHTYSRDTSATHTTRGLAMRSLLMTSSFLVLATAVSAETFQLNSDVGAVTVYPSGATITRMVTLDIPAGSHRLLIGDVPQGFDPSSLRIKGGEGLIIGATGIRTDRLPPDEREIAARTVIEEKIKTQRDLIRGRANARTGISLEIDAARARIDYLDALGEGQENGADTPDTAEILNLVGIIGQETLSALQDGHAAKLRMEEIDREISDLKEDLSDLELELAATALPLMDRVIVSLDVTAESAVNGTIQIEYLTDYAGWLPVYDVRLGTTNETLAITRQAMLTQQTGESWAGIQVKLSTARPNLRLTPGEIYPQLAFLYDQMELQRERDASALGAISMDMNVEIAAAAPMMVEEAFGRFAPVSLNFEGLTAVYTLPGAVTLDGDGTESLFTIDTTDFDTTLTAQATPLLDESVYLIADITNTSNVPFLPGRASFYRDGAFVGTLSLPMIAAGEDADLPFGAIDGLSTKRITDFAETGESGILTTSNDRQERYTLSVINKTAREWDIRLMDRVPYSEEEKLEIDVTARPAATESNVDGKRGVYAWDFTLAAGDEQSITFGYIIGWPEGKELGFQ